MILLVFALCNFHMVAGFYLYSTFHRNNLDSLIVPREITPFSSLSMARRRHTSKIFGQSTAFVSNERNATATTGILFDNEVLVTSTSDNHHSSTLDAASAGSYLPVPFNRRNFSSSSPSIPLNDIQLSALRRKIPKFTVPIEIANDDTQKKRRYAVLWRSLIDDSPELAGFPISFLREQAQTLEVLVRQSTNETSNWSVDDKTMDWEKVLPFIDAYQFESGGGLSGLVYGIAGVSDGTRIRTTPVGDVQTTLPRNFVQTADGCLYELGRPSFVEDPDLLQDTATNGVYSLSGASKRWYRDGSELASSMVAKKSNVDNLSSSPVDIDILQLSGLTALVLGGSYVLGSLSHHLTVNVFWV